MINRGNFAVRLVELLKKNKITTAVLSKATNISEITINKMRNGMNVNPTISTVVAIAKYFNVSIDYLLNEPGTTNQKLINVIDINDINAEAYWFNIDEFFTHADFAIKITNNSYPDFKKYSIALINKNAKLNTDAIILVKLNDSYLLCKLIIEGNMYIGKSLTISGKFYNIELESILGVVTGVIWKSN